jgi:hypothetical protein
VVGGESHHSRVTIAGHERQRGEAIRVGGAPGGRFEDQVLGIDLGQDGLDDLSLPHLGEHVNLVADGPRPLIRLAQQRPAVPA